MSSKKVIIIIIMVVIDSDGHLSLFTGKTTVGRNIGSDIQLAGTLVTRNHWYVLV